MRLFISWSGEPSRSVAYALRDWLRNSVDRVDVWVSQREIRGGESWRHKLVTALSESNVGIVCLTKGNLGAPWLNFEAGALAKEFETARLIPVLWQLEPDQIGGPLQHYQARTCSETDMFELMIDIYRLFDQPVEQEFAHRRFDAYWPGLETALASIRDRYPAERPLPVQLAGTVEQLAAVTQRLQSDMDQLVTRGELAQVEAKLDTILAALTIPGPRPAPAPVEQPSVRYYGSQRTSVRLARTHEKVAEQVGVVLRRRSTDLDGQVLRRLEAVTDLLVESITSRDDAGLRQVLLGVQGLDHPLLDDLQRQLTDF